MAKDNKKKSKETNTTTSPSSSNDAGVVEQDHSKDNKSSSSSNVSTKTTKPIIDKSTLINRATLKYPLFSCASGGNTDLVAVGGGGGVSKTGVPNGVTVFRWVEGMLQQLETLTADDCVSNIAFHPSLDQFAYGTRSNCHIVNFNNKLTSFEVKQTFESIPPKESKKVEESSGKREEPLLQQTCRYNRDGNRLITGGSDNSVRVWKMPECKLLNTLRGEHSDEITDVDIHPHGSHIVTTSKDKTCRVWNLVSGKVEHTFRRKHNGVDLGFRGCRFSVDGLSIFVVLSTPRGKNTAGIAIVSQYNLATGREEQTRQVHTVHNTCFELSPNGKYLAIGTGDSFITVVDTDSLKRVDRWEPHEFVITGIAFSPDSQNVVSVSADYTITAHKIGTGPKDLDYKLIMNGMNLYFNNDDGLGDSTTSTSVHVNESKERMNE
ncbi:WD-40 repeat-containing protein [Cavenderia fasciculata]|uniref:WD-40 repeat-containing protein n=1 Tax=Cavenderia fasciculata TaxID=261658 RepID=F4PT83_CACFS|nr:WD-40 repeat-containing protein [Cavenderia fasciculata]EGG20819.1 WD-40 repeat-containing protein [Cavenderia fasciculata]|eukprot:XP_004358669.1 WD-40 repeat-containing protein [Cavenderia fasciculata]